MKMSNEELIRACNKAEITAESIPLKLLLKMVAERIAELAGLNK